MLNYYSGQTPATAFQYPCIVLTDSKWDDFDFKTLFYVYYHDARATPRFLMGEIKIGEFGQKSGRTILPAAFTKLDNKKYFSLGQTRDYYKNFSSKFKNQSDQALKALCDLSVSPTLFEKAQSEPVFIRSLTRSLGSLERVVPLVIDSNLKFEFHCQLNNSKVNTDLKFEFSSQGIAPGNINVLVGKNGSGKTQLLTNLAGAIIGVENSEQVDSVRPKISMVIAVSYSVFDRFFLPSGLKIPVKGNRRTYLADELKYRYIGLREENQTTGGIRIAGTVALSRTFTAALSKIREAGTYESWALDMKPILIDAEIDASTLSEVALRKKFSQLGAGHKATLSLLTRLFSEIEIGSLVLLDEPENHLHPALLSMTMTALRSILDRKKSNAIISTHSPIVVQEVPAKYVQIIKKTDGIIYSCRLPKESFGTSVDSLITDIFGVSGDLQNYAGVLKQLAQNNTTVEELDSDLTHPLSFEARSYFKSMGKQRVQ